MKTMIVAKVIFFLTIIVEFSEPFRRNTVTVKTSLGSIRGIRMKSRERRDFVAFRGIRYAESPTGENRFRPPVPVKNWTGVYDATRDGDICIQSTPLLTRASTQSEDCLILNVYTPNIKGNRTVLFYIHGGSNVGGSSHSIFSAGPQYLMDKDIVLVTINYRLGPLGFLSTGTEDSPGNYAFKDQVLALRWVHDHIRSFGGDPNAVTIAGQSAGGFAVTLHMISPMSRGLFRSAIAMSGNEPNYAYVDNISWTKKLAKNVSCPDDNPKLLVECLRNTPTDCILEVIESWENVELPNLKWNYEIEEDFGQERFIIEDPLKTYVKGDFAKVPILTGITKDEFGPYAYYVYQKQELLDSFNENFTEIAPLVFVYKNGTKQSEEISRTLRKFYLNDEKIDDSNFDNLMHLFTDAIIVHGVHRFVSLTRRYTDVYYYRTDFMGRYSNVYDDHRKPIEFISSSDVSTYKNSKHQSVLSEVFATKTMLIANILIFLVAIINLKEAHKIQNDYVIVESSLGLIRGLKVKSRENHEFLSFRGIKYAESPTGENRFREPIPIRNWTGIYDATKDGMYCQQTLYLADASSMSEDCLIINVYTDDLNGNKAVLVYIHGGSYILDGSHSQNVVGPHYLMDKEIVLVSFNYRLGAFGFLSTRTKDSPGNNAFKDQVLALKWIRDHIKTFGGNPDAVTIFGQSAGGFAATLHMISPMSQGLFNRVIAMSGAEANHDVIDNHYWTRKLGEAFSCSVEDPKLLVECLRKIPADEIVNACDVWEGAMHLNMKWNYEIEGDFGQERFLTEHPIQILARGDYIKVPILTGITKDELGPAAYFIYHYKPEILQKFNENFNEIAPQIFAYEQGTEKSLNISRTLRKFYLNDEKIDESIVGKFGALIADGFIGHGVHRFVELTRRYTDVYYYRTDFMGRYSHISKLDGTPVGVCHSDDRAYLFVYNKFAPMFTKTDPENIMVERYTTWWTTFAKTGNPNNYANEYTASIEWNPSNATALRTLYIDTECREDTEPYQDRLRVWDELFPIPYQ